SFLIFLFVRVFGFDFLRASAVAKLVNVACNLAALALFAGLNHVFWQVGLVMAACNIMGSLMGTRLAIRGGAGLVRKVFLVVVVALILKTSADAFF
ncbi:MAG: sulfite exporter TauE/SafE family protein, partial [Betaproteobacteria bacterium]|nr:sulfite exporter TauE/SafE family protein [Betaproteobacteria bacterium]